MQQCFWLSRRLQLPVVVMMCDEALDRQHARNENAKIKGREPTDCGAVGVKNGEEQILEIESLLQHQKKQQQHLNKPRDDSEGDLDDGRKSAIKAGASTLKYFCMKGLAQQMQASQCR